MTKVPALQTRLRNLKARGRIRVENKVTPPKLEHDPFDPYNIVAQNALLITYTGLLLAHVQTVPGYRSNYSTASGMSILFQGEI